MRRRISEATSTGRSRNSRVADDRSLTISRSSVHLGEVYVAAGRPDQGVALLERVVATDPGGFEAYINLASDSATERSRARGRGDRSRPSRSIRRSVAPTRPRADPLRAGDERSALAALSQAVRYDPRDVKALVWMGMVEMNRGHRPARSRASAARPGSIQRASMGGSASRTPPWPWARSTAPPKRSGTPTVESRRRQREAGSSGCAACRDIDSDLKTRAIRGDPCIGSGGHAGPPLTWRVLKRF